MEADMDRALGRLLGEAARSEDTDLSAALDRIVEANWYAETAEQERANEQAVRAALAAEPIRDRVRALAASLDASDDPMWPSCKKTLGL